MGGAGSIQPGIGARAAMIVAGVGVLLLLGLLAREIFAHPTRSALHPASEADPVAIPSATSAAPSAPTSTARATAALPARPALSRVITAPSASPPGSAGPVLDAASALAAIVTDPRALHPTNIVPDRVKHTEDFAFESAPPFRSMQLTKDTTNAQVWKLEGLNGPKLAELGATREATVQKDDQGGTFATWYAIDSGPLAPAYATQIGEQVRLVSRAYLQANRADYPASVTTVLDH